jgi:glutathione S-transferase
MLWLLEELGLQYDVKFYRRVGGLAPPELKAVHPLGKSPVISDGELVLAESGGEGSNAVPKFCLQRCSASALVTIAAITEYLCETYDPEGKFHPLSSEKRAWIDHRYWLHYSEVICHSGLNRQI